MRLRRLATLFAAVIAPLALLAPSPMEASASAPLVIRVDHLDPAHQQIDPVTGHPKQGGELWQYTDFFSRSVTVQQGDTLDFNFVLPGHVIGLAKDEAAARQALPLFTTDNEDGRVATGSGAAPLMVAPFGAAFVFGGGPPACGVTSDKACNFTGAFDPSIVAGLPGGNWFVQVNAPVGEYHYFCFIHPGMSGKVRVVAGGHETTTQDNINEQSAGQFESDREQAARAEAKANVPHFTGEEPGTRTYTSFVGLSAAKNHVAMFEMLPRHLDLVQGDKVRFLWQNVEGHTVTFPSTFDPNLFAPDCAPPDQIFGIIRGSPPPGIPACGDSALDFPEILADTGTSQPGTVLTGVSAQVDSGILVGAGYGIAGSVHSWSLATNASTATTAAFPYNYHCAIHDWMFATIDVRASDGEHD